MNQNSLHRSDLLYPELSYQILGCAFDVHNTIGPGHHEGYYQKALSVAFRDKGLKYREQVYQPLYYKNKLIGKNFFDFLIDDKIVVEIKKGSVFSKTNIDQVLNYLKTANLKLAILINFGSNGVTFKRIINI